MINANGPDSNKQVAALKAETIHVDRFPVIAPEVDDTARIQRAIDYTSSQGGGIIEFASKTYTISSALYLKSKVTLEGKGGKSTVIQSSTTGTALYIQGTPTTPKEWISVRSLLIQAINVTNAPIVYMDAAYYVEFSDVNVFGDSASINTGSIGMHIVGTNTGYYANFIRSQFAFCDTGVKLETSSNAHRFMASWFYGCNVGMEIIDSDGVLVQGCTFQDFFKKGIKFTTVVAGKTHGNTVFGNYFERDVDSLIVECAIELGTGVRTTMLYGNNYTNLRPTYPELIDNGIFTTRLEFGGASYFETLKIPNFMNLPSFVESTKPVVDSRFRGSLAHTTIDATTQDKLRVIVQDKNGVMQWAEIPYVVNSVMIMPGNSAIQNGAIYQFNDGYVLLGTMVSAQERALNYDSGFKKVRYHNGTAWKYLPGVDSGTTANRPTGAAVLVGQEYFDTSLGKPVWCKVSGATPTWVDATGTTV